MAPTPSEAFTTIEARLWAILDPYRDRLEPNDIYGMPTLRWPGAKAHDFFAGVRIAPRHVAYHLMPVHSDPQLLEGVSDTLRKRLKGATTFNFTDEEEELFAELEALTARSFAVYAAAHTAS